MTETIQTIMENERAIGLATQLPGQSDAEVRHSLEELRELLKTADVEMVGTLIQKRDRTSRALYMGTGKIEEIAEAATAAGANLIVADDELTALQIKTIEEATKIPVCDRTSIILEIFARRASTREGKLQVELASLQYQMLRLVGGYENLSRQRGGIGVKGPGETKLETDRRVIKNRLKKLREELEKSVQDREIQSRKRQDRLSSVFSLVGYTNAGKSTLLNALSGSEVEMCNGLFTTLDPTARRIDLPNSHWCIMTDTVGFIRKLPHGLVKAFKATLECVVQAEVLVIVSDVSDPQFREHLEAVDDVLAQIGASRHEKIYVFNKIDRGPAISEELLRAAYPDCIMLSAMEKTNLDLLKKRMETIMCRNRRTVALALPANSAFVGEAMKIGRIFSQEWESGKVKIVAELPKRFLAMVQDYITDDDPEI